VLKRPVLNPVGFLNELKQKIDEKIEKEIVFFKTKKTASHTITLFIGKNDDSKSISLYQHAYSTEEIMKAIKKEVEETQ
jgi:hypothetical protein